MHQRWWRLWRLTVLTALVLSPEPDFRRLLEHIIIIIFRGVVGFSKSPRLYPLHVHVTL